MIKAQNIRKDQISPFRKKIFALHPAKASLHFNFTHSKEITPFFTFSNSKIDVLKGTPGLDQFPFQNYGTKLETDIGFC